MITHICADVRLEECGRTIMSKIPKGAPWNRALSEYNMYFAWLAHKHSEAICVDGAKRFRRRHPTKQKQDAKSEDCSLIEDARQKNAVSIKYVVLESKSDPPPTMKGGKLGAEKLQQLEGEEAAAAGSGGAEVIGDDERDEEKNDTLKHHFLRRTDRDQYII